MKTKHKTHKVKPIKKQLWEIFAEFIRRRDADEDGVVFCISCGAPVIWNKGNCHAGHYYNKGSYLGLKYNEKNVNGQCYECNMNKEGNKQGYREGLIEKYGKEVLLELEVQLRNKGVSGRAEHVILIEHYKQKVKDLKQSKPI